MKNFDNFVNEQKEDIFDQINKLERELQPNNVSEFSDDYPISMAKKQLKILQRSKQDIASKKDYIKKWLNKYVKRNRPEPPSHIGRFENPVIVDDKYVFFFTNYGEIKSVLKRVNRKRRMSWLPNGQPSVNAKSQPTQL